MEEELYNRITNEIDLSIDYKGIDLNIGEIIQNSDVKKAVNNKFSNYMNEFVPFDNGVLSKRVSVNADEIFFAGPYAHYMYEGLTMGPNIPIIQNGVITGWFSPPGEPKQYTGETLNYDTSVHPNATSHWDSKAYEVYKDDINKNVAEIVIKKGKENG